LIESGYMANAEKLGETLRVGLRAIAEKHKVVTNVRGLGLMCAVDIVSKKTGKGDAKLREKIIKTSFERGLVLLPCGEIGIRFVPPLCINETQLDVGLKLFDEAIATVA